MQFQFVRLGKDLLKKNIVRKQGEDSTNMQLKN